ncbi:sulfotransferase family protein [Desulfurobacterium thermolithotrophum]|uniref:sulfotransferase family protein n=1 Tax=Desulfurobacterium thermolithotrophum TaxID=64160 RepID=UPI0013D13119|nr:sulfotransferase [Desulfurobacterium thermolithotrophum]
MQVKPNFFVVGTAKAGTTSLYYYLKQHPEIYLSPIKETNFFAKDIDISKFTDDYKRTMLIDLENYFSKEKLEEIPIAIVNKYSYYEKLFQNVTNEKVIGEISNSYLYSKVAAKEIYKFNPHAKIIMILRNPVDRAYSHYIMNVREGYEVKQNFIEEIYEDFNKKEKGWGVSHLYIELGLYYEQVKRYLETFPEENIKIIYYEDYSNDVANTVKNIFEFLNVNKEVDINFNIKANQGLKPKNQFVNKVLFSIARKMKPLIPKDKREKLREYYFRIFFEKKKNISELDKEKLIHFFYEDVAKLSDMLNIDLLKKWNFKNELS